MDKIIRKKYKFHQDSVSFYLYLSFIISLSLITIGMIQYSWRIGEVFSGAIISSLCLIFLLYFEFKKYSNIIVLTIEGVEVRHFTNRISFNKWEDFEDASIKMKLRSRYITLKIKKINRNEIKDKCIEFNINNRKLSLLKTLCKDNELKIILENIQLNNFFRYY